ncbi:MAG: diaminopimelate decarboxylase [Gammaproteobacteria bacterium]|jgi:diaminopimelate decarboxylase|nr:diaminopimelate decarboxylase [Gammaproteobacteria bacterium]MDP7089574.1 diaminopimelate decarboxylase [Dehalococcoidia bacterium]|tara:strand:- start:49113 stop:50363 length:1251 start_codon:yes stop_codon:yes gene_type:complete
MSEFEFLDGQLHAEGVPLSKIAEEYGTPTFVYSKASIVTAYENFQAAFSGHDHQICYAVKANSNLGILSLLASMGSGFDIVSGGELQRVLKAGGEAAKVVFSGVGKQAWEIELAIEKGIGCFNLESDSELNLVNEIAARLNKIAAISVRVNPDVDAKTHPYTATGLKENKFGVSAREAVAIYRRAAKLSNIEIQGIDYHIGSQITDISPLVDSLAHILELVDELETMNISLSHIDVGGGIGITYKDEQSINIDEYASAILQTLGDHGQKLLFEPGRYIVGNAGILLSRVVTIKQNDNKKFAVVDAAMNDLIRPALYQSWQRIENIEQSSGPRDSYDVVGPICESADFLGKNRELPLCKGDLVAVYSSGAYGFVMSSNYNSRNRAAELLVSGTDIHCIRQRESFADQIRLESIPGDD